MSTGKFMELDARERPTLGEMLSALDQRLGNRALVVEAIAIRARELPCFSRPAALVALWEELCNEL